MIWGTLLHECSGVLGLVLSVQGLVFRVARVLPAPRSAPSTAMVPGRHVICVVHGAACCVQRPIHCILSGTLPSG